MLLSRVYVGTLCTKDVATSEVLERFLSGSAMCEFGPHRLEAPLLRRRLLREASFTKRRRSEVLRVLLLVFSEFFPFRRVRRLRCVFFACR